MKKEKISLRVAAAMSFIFLFFASGSYSKVFAFQPLALGTDWMININPEIRLSYNVVVSCQAKL